jgi:hypothetical protein
MKRTVGLFSSASLITLTLGACSLSPQPGCEDVFRKEVVSENQPLKAVIVDVRCGATTPDSSRVLLTGTMSKFDREKDVVAIFHGIAKSISWSDQKLVIDPGSAEPFTTSQLFKGLVIQYKDPGSE